MNSHARRTHACKLRFGQTSSSPLRLAGIDFSFFFPCLFPNGGRTKRDGPSARWKLTKQFLAEPGENLIGEYNEGICQLWQRPIVDRSARKHVLVLIDEHRREVRYRTP